MVSARDAVAAVVDPEIRAVTIDELGILRGVEEDPTTGRVTVTITPTYSGCPAMDVIRSDIRRALATAGYPDAEVRTVLAPAWSTEMISEVGRAKLAAAGIAPPPTSTPPTTTSSVAAPSSSTRPSVVALRLSLRCPRCGSAETEELSHFGSTACKALWRCRACTEPFEHVKPL